MTYHQLKTDETFLAGSLTTKDCPICSCRQIIGQDRALAALNFGIQLKDKNAHLFCLGAKGVGRTSLTLDIVRQYASTQPTPKDWIYVMNFDNSLHPIAFALESGQAPLFQKQVQQLRENLKKGLKYAFNNDHYRLQFNQIQQQIQIEKQNRFQNIAKQINTESVALVHTPDGLGLNPVVDGKIINADAFNNLPVSVRAPVMKQMEKARQKLLLLIQTIPHQDTQKSLIENLIHTTLCQVAKCFDPLIQKYKKADVVTFLNQAKNYFIQNGSGFINNPANELWTFLDVNVLTTHSPNSGAPVIHLNNLTFAGLFGKVEREQKSGSMLYNHMMIQAGALHQANGGFLVIEAKDIPMEQSVWHTLKQTLFNHKIHMDVPQEERNIVSLRALLPMDIPLDTKVILVGSLKLYYDLLDKEEDFTALFKLPVRFDELLPRNHETEKVYAGILTDFSNQNHLKPLTLSALNQLLAYASRLAFNQNFLTCHFVRLHDTIREADFLAKGNNITQSDILNALQNAHQRTNTLWQNWVNDLKNQTIQLDLSGKKVGQINALTINGFQDFSFGHPAKITCQAHLGSGKIEDVENQIGSGGKIHSKGIFILSSYLMAQYGFEEPFCWDASIVWEQLYHGVEGDSASMAQLCVLMSAIANIPLKQSIALTGSVNQMGQAQSVGSINLKVEGFFDTCQAMGLTDNQGVIIPEVCIHDLMLDERVQKAVQENKFHIYTIQNVMDAMEILTDLKSSTIHQKMKQAWHKAYLKMKNRH